MSERWIKESEQLLEKMKELSSKEKRDRLEIINSMIFALNILDRSIHGWGVWIRNLSLMSKFTLEELAEIEAALKKQIEPFIKYDVEATNKWKDKFPQIQVLMRRRREGENRGMREGENRGIYV